ncbi:hypothetical protein [Streptomyces sp. NPDC051636]|uniref:hypothetical protein n=1 Tax=Streptomyces sp. NPDC051636 TaxID=3365663 RepID=UPI0037A64912
MPEQKSPDLPRPLRTAASALRRVPGAGAVGKVTEDALNKVGSVSPRGRRLAVYTGAGILGVTGAVEWPVALTGAAVAWLTQPRPQHSEPVPASSGSGPASGKHPTTSAGRPAASDWTTTAVRRRHGSD